MQASSVTFIPYPERKVHLFAPLEPNISSIQLMLLACTKLSDHRDVFGIIELYFIYS